MKQFSFTWIFIIYNLKTKQVVCGLGEIGNPIYKILKSANPTEGFDIGAKLLSKHNSKLDGYETQFLLHLREISGEDGISRYLLG